MDDATPGGAVRWGILGAGAIAATVAADIAATDGARLFAVAARDATRAADFAAEHGVARSHGSYGELVADPDVDVVYVATTHGQHHEHALLALGAGKPLLVEKAFTLNARQAREVVAAARARGLFCMEAMWPRLDPLWLRARDLVHDATIGDVVSVRADLSRRFPFDPSHRLFDLAAGGGALLDLGVYPAAFVWSLLGRPDTVHAAGTLAPTGADLTVAMQWGYPDGRVAQLHVSAAAASPAGALVVGTEGWFALEPRLHRPQRLVLTVGDETTVVEAAAGPGNGYRREVAEVTARLRAGDTESPHVPLDDTVGILEVLDEARRQVGARYPADADGSPV